MQPASDSNHRLPRAEVSRRAFLQASAIGASAGLISAGEAASETAGWSLADIPDLTGRTVLVTGGNGYPQEDRSGLGYHTALALARAGADVTIASRNQPRGEEAVRRIRADAPGAKIRFETLDLASLDSVAAFSARWDATGRSLDVLINNAGVMGRLQREVSVDGLERVFATNTVGHFALTARLLPHLIAGQNARIVWVCSLRMSTSLPFDDLQQTQSYDYAAAYDRSKLANLLLAQAFERRSRAGGWGITSLASQPGVARTSLIPDGPGLNSVEGQRFTTIPQMFQPPAHGALSALYAAVSALAVGGGYYGPSGPQGLKGPPGVTPIPPAAQDQAAAATLWAALEGLSRVSPEAPRRR